MQASTVSAIAGSASATIGAVSATIAAISAFNSRRSAQASMEALRETRQQRVMDEARGELRSLGTLYDDADSLIQTLATDLRRDRAAVERARERLRRTMMVAGLTTSALVRLADATTPLSAVEISAVRDEITGESARLQRLLTGSGPRRTPISPQGEPMTPDA